MRRFSILFFGLILSILACIYGTPPAPTAIQSVQIDQNLTAYGFFPSPPEVTLESILTMYQDFSDHADVVLLQQNIPWQEFSLGAEVTSDRIKDINNQYILAAQNDLEIVFVVDPLNGLNRREFMGLPQGWEATFANPSVRTAFTNFTLRILREFKPRYLGLASEINTYADSHPEDFPNFVSLYETLYDMIKKESPQTQVFVTFQWEDLNNLIPTATEGRQPFTINWETIEMFEPELDLWVISSYPFVVFETAGQIPSNYYTPLLDRTEKSLAVGEGGFTSRDIDTFHGDPQSQVGYLQAIHEQIGARLAFWIYLLLNDFNIDSYGPAMIARGMSEQDIETFRIFDSVGLREYDGTPKPALQTWDSYRSSEK